MRFVLPKGDQTFGIPLAPRAISAHEPRFIPVETEAVAEAAVAAPRLAERPDQGPTEARAGRGGRAARGAGRGAAGRRAGGAPQRAQRPGRRFPADRRAGRAAPDGPALDDARPRPPDRLRRAVRRRGHRRGQGVQRGGGRAGRRRHRSAGPAPRRGLPAAELLVPDLRRPAAPAAGDAGRPHRRRGALQVRRRPRVRPRGRAVGQPRPPGGERPVEPGRLAPGAPPAPRQRLGRRRQHRPLRHRAQCGRRASARRRRRSRDWCPPGSPRRATSRTSRTSTTSKAPSLLVRYLTR